MKKHTITLLTLIIAALTLITHVSSQEGAKVRLKMASGFSGGTYDKMATALSAIPGLEVSNRTTTGSEENLQLVKQKLADVAFVQTDNLMQLSTMMCTFVILHLKGFLKISHLDFNSPNAISILTLS